MRNLNQKSKKEKLVITSVIVTLLVAVGLFTHTLSPLSNSDDSGNQTQPTNSEGSINTPNEATPDEDVEDGNRSNSGDPDEANRNDSDNESHQHAKSSARIHIPNYQAHGDGVTVNVAISETWGDDARCVMRVNGPRSSTVTETVFAQAQISGCQMVADDLPAGSYRLEVYAEKGNERTNTETINVNI